MTATPSENNLHIWRSKTIDAFALIECGLERLLYNLGKPVNCDRLGPKIEAVRKFTPQAHYTADKKAAVDKILDQIAKLLPLRNDLVHSPMIIRKEPGKVVGVFSNPNALCDFSKVSREVEAPRLQALAAKAAHLHKELEKLVDAKPTPPAKVATVAA